MKRLLVILTLTFALVASVFAQSQIGIRPWNWTPERPNAVRSQSLTVNQESRNISVLWLQDGLSSNYTAVSYPLFQITGLGNRLEIVGLGAFNSDFSRTNVWAGTGLSLNIVETQGWKLNAYGGWKGFNLGRNFDIASNREGWVYGFGLTVPVR